LAGGRFFVELKAQAPQGLEALRKRLSELGASLVGVYHQVDTYFPVPQGRLKIREVDGEKVYLIYYEREDIPTPKRNKAYLLEVDGEMKDALTKILKPTVVVDKRREVYHIDNLRIHLDSVRGLGDFVEFELPVSGDPESVEEGKHKLREYMRLLGIEENQLISVSYSDLLLTRGPKARGR